MHADFESTSNWYSDSFYCFLTEGIRKIFHNHTNWAQRRVSEQWYGHDITLSYTRSYSLFVLISGHRNLRTVFRDYHHKPEGVYMVDPLAGKVTSKKPAQPVKLLSVEGLKRALRFVEDIALLFIIYFNKSNFRRI